MTETWVIVRESPRGNACALVAAATREQALEAEADRTTAKEARETVAVYITRVDQMEKVGRP